MEMGWRVEEEPFSQNIVCFIGFVSRIKNKTAPRTTWCVFAFVLFCIAREYYIGIRTISSALDRTVKVMCDK